MLTGINCYCIKYCQKQIRGKVKKYLFYYYFNILCLYTRDAETTVLQRGLKYKYPKDIVSHTDLKS